ncbi:MAG: hypothetical protein LDL51_07425 [Chloroflexi bacterium]|nr:hypothetical protein [Chloroflexota bacterium]
MAQEKGGRRYPLVVYTRMMDRWWPAVFWLGAFLLVIAWLLRWWNFESWRWVAFAVVGGLNLAAGLTLLLLRRSAYIQLFGNHFKLATPFLRMKVSYKRIRRTSTSNMGKLFPRASVSAWRAEIIEPLAMMTAVVVELSGYPVSKTTLRLFLSPLFFKDDSPHFVILVNDWMEFNAQLDSARRGAGGGSVSPQRQKRSAGSILARLPQKK